MDLRRWMVGGVFSAFLFCLMLSARPLPAGGEEGKTEQPLPASAEDVCPRLVGTEAPDVTLKAMDGTPFSLKAAVSEKPAILVFYRGWW